MEVSYCASNVLAKWFQVQFNFQEFRFSEIGGTQSWVTCMQPCQWNEFGAPGSACNKSLRCMHTAPALRSTHIAIKPYIVQINCTVELEVIDTHGRPMFCSCGDSVMLEDAW